MVSAPMCSKYFVAPVESLSRSNPVSQRGGPANGRAALALTEFAHSKPD